MSPIEKLIAYFGSQAKIARKLGVSPAAVAQWVKDGTIPAQRAIQIEVLSEGELKAKELVQ